MHTEALNQAQLELLEGLKKVEQVPGFYLAGETALALHYGHRRSIDFDFYYHRLRALAYFDDAEREPMPDMLKPLEWEDVRAFFTTESTRLLRSVIDQR